MIKKYNHYIKETIERSEIDPYGINKFDKDILNEKIKWKDLLIGLIMFNSTFMIKNTYIDYKTARQLYDIVNSPDYILKDSDKKLIDNIRKNIIDDIKISPLFKNLDREYIVDSIQNATIRISEPNMILKNVSAACFISLSNIERNKFIYKKYISKENIIIINKEYINYPDLSSLLTHEIYHYIDKLYGEQDDYTSNINLNEFLDKLILSDDDYANSKIKYLFKLNNQEIKKIHTVDLLKIYRDDYDYYTSNKEIFARWKTLKSKIVRTGILKDMNDNLTEEKLNLYLKSADSINPTELDILVVLDLNKIEKLDEFLK